MAKKKKAAKKAKKVVAKKKVRKTTVSRKKTGKKAPGLGLEKIGEVTHYFPHVNAAAVLLLKDGLKIGDKIYLKGHTTDFKENVQSIQLDHVSIQEGKKAQEIGLLVKSRVRIGDSVYRI
ncbi:MAG: translation elongation factor-like protein [Candidatus Omnitrophica bacterium]|nr:translation elongation factor-like protein [Candidatus Omnitrophota bacterium]